MMLIVIFRGMSQTFVRALKKQYKLFNRRSGIQEWKKIQAMFTKILPVSFDETYAFKNANKLGLMWRFKVKSGGDGTSPDFISKS